MRSPVSPAAALAAWLVASLAGSLAPAAPSSPGAGAWELGPTRNVRLDAWRVIGPGGGGTMRRPAISPHDPRFVVEGCDMTGAYITKDGGRSWRMFNLGTAPSSFAFDPKDPRVLYATTAALWRSEDAGVTWRVVYPDPAKNTKVHAWTDHGDFVITTDDPAFPGSGRDTDVHTVAIDPRDTDRLAIAVSTAESPRPGSATTETVVLLSGDRGRSWTRLGAMGKGRAFALRFEGDDLLAVGESGVYAGGSGRFERRPAPAPGSITSASFGRDSASGRTLLYATTPVEPGTQAPVGGLYVSEDGGATWRAANGELLLASTDVGKGESWGAAKGSRPSLGPVAASEGHGLVAYVGLRGLKRTSDGPKYNGIAKTTDGGRTWSVVHEEADRKAENHEGSWFEERGTEGQSLWFDAPYDLAAAPSDPRVAFATDLFRTYRTVDGGATWSQVHSERRSAESWVSRGLDVMNAYGIHWDPFDHRRVFISYTDMGMFRSEDGGASWIPSTTGVPQRWRNTTYWVDFDPEVKGLMWGAFAGNHDLPRPKMWRHTDPDRFRGGVGVSTDGGRTWTPSNAGMPETAVTHVLVDPASPKERRTLYATGFGRGFFKSTDGGKSWTAKNQGIVQKQPFAWRITRDPQGVLYLVVARRSERGEIGDERDGALYRSTDGAESWTRIALPAGTNGPNGLAVDPRDPKRLYLAAWGRATPGGDTGGGIFASDDAGTSWRPLLEEFQHVYDVTVDPRDPNVIYASGFDQSALRSTDRGRTWRRLRGFNFKWGYRVIPDPLDASKVYVTTFGGSVWHGPAEGDPAAVEDVVPADQLRSGGVPGPRPSPEKLARLVEANVKGVHAYQLLLARKDGKGDPRCWPRDAPSDDVLKQLVAHQDALVKADPEAIRAWTEGGTSSFDPAKDLEPLAAAPLPLADDLPVNVFARDLEQAAPGRTPAEIRALASLYQTVLEVERDGDRLQDLYRLYIPLGLPVSVEQLGLPGGDDDLLEVGKRLEGRACASPFGLTAAEWQIAGRKIWNWGRKNRHTRDARVVALELLAEPELAALVPKLRAAKPRRIAVIGHSFTMDLHWASPSAFVPIATAVLKQENPRLEVRQFEGGGLTATRARQRFYADALAWKPDVVLFVVANRTDADLEAFREMGRGFKAAGATVYTFDNVRLPAAARPGDPAKDAVAAREAGMEIVEVEALLEASPERERFLCLDGIHMTEPYHRLMAVEWLKLLAGARGPALRAESPR
jgi:photosystem II stability/assembly factor-like uncharacterized protein